MIKMNAVILAGGLARRLNGLEKGLQPIAGQPLLSHIITRLSPQVSEILLNINRSQAEYERLYPNLTHYADELTGFQGPLSGMLTGLRVAKSEYVLFVPCDSPFLPHNLAEKLYRALNINQTAIAYAHDGERPHPTFALIHRDVAQALDAYLNCGERRLLAFFQSQKSIAVDFSDQPEAFQNLNTPADFQSNLQRLKRTAPLVLAITGYSGAGKTTLLEKLIPLLVKAGLKVGLIKHSHHNLDIDKAGKDSYRLRMAGTNPTVVACDNRWALMVETQMPISFDNLLEKFHHYSLDLVLVEGFKHESLPKIQLHRQGLDKPLPELDSYTLATATDYMLERENLLDLNNLEQICHFILDYVKNY
ncbi:molybdopterin-guanine dinucleotide biosynthesis protein [Nicoletella semolina]|uniref:Molybdenum cofactor guanylyltransferase n=1 Tax=Nicoletella semolina TaxID=271160 RepID=A0A4R2N4G6_9PAST|nr:molybdenum cofactor guanylyltransferase MobA [Nicoletella semolina]MDH2925078.1 molybdenum cofactor guanylyltransferase [Nicoletella semolina]TCP15405.1 molybdopterin-guanine dinucleotide biosynthesis protein [Nicoletella semolina]